MPNYDAVIDKLIAKSEAGTVPWKPTYQDDAFIAAIEGEVTFEVSKLADGGFTFLMKDADSRKIIDITCHDRPAYDNEYEANDRFFDKISELFEAARIVALEVDKKLNVAEALLDRF